MEKEIPRDIYKALEISVNSKLVWIRGFRLSSFLIVWREKLMNGFML